MPAIGPEPRLASADIRSKSRRRQRAGSLHDHGSPTVRSVGSAAGLDTVSTRTETSPRTISSSTTARRSHQVFCTSRVVPGRPVAVVSTTVPLTRRQPGSAAAARKSLR